MYPDFPPLPYRFDLPSDIHGLGAFAIRLIHKGEMIPGGLVAGMEFRGFNHSCDPNLGERPDPQMGLRPALRDIQPGEELTVRYHDDVHIERNGVWCNCDVCKGRHYSNQCRCPIHRRG